MNFHAMEVAEMPDITEENNILEKSQDILEKEYVMEENNFHDVKKTVEDIVESLTEDILETVMVTEDIFEIVTVINDDLLGTVAAEDIPQIAKTNINISDSLGGSVKKTMKRFERTENHVLFQKNVWPKFEKECISDKVSENGIPKKAANNLLKVNALPSREDILSLKKLMNYLSPNSSNQIPFKEIVEKMNIPKLITNYAEYRRSIKTDLSTLYDKRIVLNDYLEESSFIAQQCQIAMADTDPMPDVNAMSEQELKTIERSLMEKVTVYKECLRSLSWNLDSVNNEIRLFKRLNDNIYMKSDKFLNLSFLIEKKKE